MKRLALFLALAVVFLIPLVALAQYDNPTGGSGSGGDSGSSGGGITVGGSGGMEMPALGGEGGDVSIVDFAFQPSFVSVAAGSEVQWQNTGTAPHTVTAASGAFDSGVIGSGGGYSETFADPGVYRYHCTIHPNMMGTVMVTGS
jgi:plastocyanin